jgi:HK97 family phage portal protein
MALLDVFKGLLKRDDKRVTYAKMLDGTLPLFSQFGQNIYASDIVQMAIDRIATEMSKLQPRHIRVDPNGIQKVPESKLNRLFRFAPNPLMTTADFVEKITWLLFMHYNCFIYPMYETVEGAQGIRREHVALYPLNPSTVTFLQDSAGTLFVKFDFPGGASFDLAYADVIHLRKRFSVNSLMGGGIDGQPDNTALLKVLNINHTIMEGLGKAIKVSMSVRGVLKINTLLDDEKQEAERRRFEAAIAKGESGIIPMDLKGEYIDLKPDPKIIDKDTMAFIQDKILNWYGVPLAILSGDYTDEQYQAWYESTLNPLTNKLGQAFSRTLFTPTEQNHGNKVVFYHRDMMYLSTKSKLELLKTAGEQGLLTDDQKLAILGYPPLPDGTGNRRTISLNYISTEIADQYQLERAGGLNGDSRGDEHG